MYEKVKKLLNIYILSVFVIYICIFGSTALNDYKSSLILSIVIGILSIPVYLIGKKTNEYRILNPIVNSIAIGFCVGSLYSYFELNITLINIILPILIIIDFIVVNKLIMKNLKSYKWIMLTNVFIGIVSIIISLTQYSNNKILFSQIIFLSITHISYFSAVSLLMKDKYDLWFLLSITYFLAFVIIFILVICIITESGDVFEVLSEFKPSTNKRKKTSQIN